MQNEIHLNFGRGLYMTSAGGFYFITHFFDHEKADKNQ